MTIKEIARLCGVDERTVLRWAHKAAEKASPAADILSADNITPEEKRIAKGIRQKLENSGHGFSADYDLSETLSAIRDGGGNNTLAALLAENAANKDQLVVYHNRNNGLRDELEAIIDKKIQAGMQGIQKELAEIRKLIALPAPAVDNNLQKIMAFIENHAVFTGNENHLVKQCNVWALYKHVTDNPGKMGDFITRFCMIYGQDRDFKHQNVRAFSGFRLKDTQGVCGEEWD